MFLEGGCLMKRVFSLGLGIVLILFLGACKKKEEKPVPQVAPQAPSFHGPRIAKGETKVIVPDDVKGKWAAVKILVEDKKARKTQEYTVNLHSDFRPPGTDLKISVEEFIPDFKMNMGTITSASNEQNNSAVGIKVFEGEKEIFKGWLFSKFPTVHPFEHPDYSLTLKEGVERKQ
jgi:Uncharacterized protein conserved in bacteria (DUF2155)